MSRKSPEAMSLPARYYIDPDHYRAELEWFFFGMWFHAGRADEIPNPGDFVVLEIAGESLILVRDDRGALNAFYNVCRHRGTRLTEESVGEVRGDDPVSLPRLDLRPGRRSGRRPADGRRAPVSGWATIPCIESPVAVWDGHVFLNLGDKPDPLAQQLDGSDERFRLWGWTSFDPGSASSTTWRPTGSRSSTTIRSVCTARAFTRRCRNCRTT